MLVLLVGKTCSGKSSLLEELTPLGFEKYVTATTRPPRVGEVDGTDYHFLSDEEYLSQAFIEKEEFTMPNGIYRYGTPLSGLDLSKNQVLIVTPHGLEEFKKRGIPHVSIMVTADDEIIKDRYIQREKDSRSTEQILADYDKRKENDGEKFENCKCDYVYENNTPEDFQNFKAYVNNIMNQPKTISSIYRNYFHCEMSMADSFFINTLSQIRTPIYFDIDGTMAEWRNVKVFEELFSKNYFSSLSPHWSCLALCNFLSDIGMKTSSLSAVLRDSKYALSEKKDWLKRLCTVKNQKFCYCGENKSALVNAKAKKAILIDDYNQNLKSWGGVAIKYCVRGQNDKKGSFVGRRLYDEQNPKDLLLSFAVMLTEKNKQEKSYV